jgi:hypothetical protein
MKTRIRQGVFRNVPELIVAIKQYFGQSQCQGRLCELRRWNEFRRKSTNAKKL